MIFFLLMYAYIIIWFSSPCSLVANYNCNHKPDEGIYDEGIDIDSND
jgi:hypothetical protein